MLGFDVIPSLVGILFIVIPSLLLGRLCARIGLSEIIGFVIGGVFLGPFALGGIIPFFDKPIVQLDVLTLGLWQMSGIVILFAAGLHFTFKDILAAGYKSAIIGTAGLIMPLVLGYTISLVFGFDWIISVLIGATLSATSIVISVTLLEELGKEKTPEGNILVNAAVIDDVLGLAVLSSVVSIITLNSIPSIESVLITAAESFGLWIVLLLVAVFVLPKIIHGIALAKPTSLELRGIKQSAAIGSAFGFAALASIIGLNPILGAFAAGMGLAGSKLAGQIREFTGELKIIVAPLFFAIIGAHVDLRQISEVNVIFLLAVLAVAILSKMFGCGVPATILLKNKTKGFRIGYGMIARGEVAFITAGIGVVSGVLPDFIYTLLILVILATIVITPILLKNSFKSAVHNSSR
ncbi:MAG: cation:proton antiporter [Nitrosopumilales archaeon CG_4_9_14_0_2_um_filter_34_16]|nr:MAG: cation:proton antiporter [Nitrosopumilales archaeon CG_4_9_14_0_2_um_filter_34_16]